MRFPDDVKHDSRENKPDKPDKSDKPEETPEQVIDRLSQSTSKILLNTKDCIEVKKGQFSKANDLLHRSAGSSKELDIKSPMRKINNIDETYDDTVLD